jgi:predicted PolB exonuclease-like 3'-5' exonuclease
MKLFFDLETIPAPEKLREIVVESERKKTRNREISGDDEVLYRTSAISGDFGQIFCIGYATDENPVQITSGSESQILTKWWQIAKDAHVFIGHNIIDFDIPFLYKRSVVHKIRPSQQLPVKRFQTENIFDTAKEWSRWDNYAQTSLHNLSIALGLPTSKDKMDGSMVYDFYLKKRYQDIYTYCKKDVELTRQVYKRMLFL